MPFGLMGISTMDEAILVKRLGITHFLRRKISLSKTLKSGLLSKCSVSVLAGRRPKPERTKHGLECSRSNTINMLFVISSQSLCYNFGVYFSNHVSVPEFFCLHHGLGPCSATAGWSFDGHITAS